MGTAASISVHGCGGNVDGEAANLLKDFNAFYEYGAVLFGVLGDVVELHSSCMPWFKASCMLATCLALGHVCVMCRCDGDNTEAK